MFGFSLAEITVVALVALILLGPERLPQVMRMLAKGYMQLTRIRSEFGKAMEANLAPLDPKKWADEVKKIAPEIEEIKGLGDEVKKMAAASLEATTPSALLGTTPDDFLAHHEPGKENSKEAEQAAASLETASALLEGAQNDSAVTGELGRANQEMTEKDPPSGWAA
jgi:sec-independent protein translocase protein TatB